MSPIVYNTKKMYKKTEKLLMVFSMFLSLLISSVFFIISKLVNENIWIYQSLMLLFIAVFAVIYVRYFASYYEYALRPDIASFIIVARNGKIKQPLWMINLNSNCKFSDKMPTINPNEKEKTIIIKADKMIFKSSKNFLYIENANVCKIYNGKNQGKKQIKAIVRLYVDPKSEFYSIITNTIILSLNNMENKEENSKNN